MIVISIKSQKLLKALFYILLPLTGGGWVGVLSSCSSDDLEATSIFQDSKQPKSDFDLWIYENYVVPYNIDLKYRLEDKETDFQHYLVPADKEQSKKLAMAVLYCWLQAYDEVAGIDFTRTYAPKIIQFVGSYAHNKKGTVKMGTAEDGLKVTLYAVNFFKTDKNTLNDYFQIMHHEFTHILTQSKDYTTDFRTISDTKYVTGEWSTIQESDALKAGFINAYAMSEYNEDFAETLSFYLIYTKDQWAQKMRTAGTEGAAIIDRKLTVIREYMKSAWDIDLDQMRDVLQRRIDNVLNGTVKLTGEEFLK